MQFSKHELYGGGISVDLPSGLIDASTLRQIPDTQEVFLSNTDNISNPNELLKTDTIIVDLMEKEVGVEGEEAVNFHLVEIANLNGAQVVGEDIKVLDTQGVELATTAGSNKAYVTVGFEFAKKWGRDITPLVIVLGLIRLEKVTTDVLVTFNIPIETEQEFDELRGIENLNSTQNATSTSIYQKIKIREDAVVNILKSFKVENWQLFG